MECVFFADIFHPDVVDDQCELDWVQFVAPESWYQLALVIASFFESFFQKFICQKSRLWESIHSSVGLNVYHSLAFCHLSEFVFDDDFFWYVVDADADELGSFQRCHKVEIRYVYCHESRSLG